MADTITLQFRGCALEDLQTSASLAQVNVPVLGVGSSVPVTPYVIAANDAAATSAGLGVGDVYYNNGLFPNRLRSNGGGGGSPVTKITGSTTQSVGELFDGETLLLTTFSVVGVLLGDPVGVGTDPALPTGVQAIGKVTSAGNVAIEVWNESSLPQTIGSVVFNVTVIH